jgi:hypothetical protein
MIKRYSLILSILMTCLVLAADAPKVEIKGEMTVDKEAKTITIPAVIAPRKLEYLDQIYPLEVIATLPHPRGKKAHETVLNYDVKPSDVHKALESLGLKAGKPAQGDEKPEGPELKLFLEFTIEGGDSKRVPLEKALVDKKTGKSMPALKWYFTGSVMKQIDPEKPETTYGADVTGTLIGIFPVTNETVIQTSLSMKDEPLIKLETDKKVLPPEGTAIKLIMQVK